MTTPCNGSRDRIEPYFENNLLHVASYTYICEDDLESIPTLNKVSKIDKKLSTLPKITENQRILILDKNGDLYYDSMDVTPFNPIDEGFMILI